MAISESKRNKTKEVRNYGKIKDFPLPNLLDIQKESVDWFMKEGIFEAFNDVFPIVGPGKNLVLEFVDLRFEDAKYSIEHARDRYLTYSSSMKVKLRLINNIVGEVKEADVYFGEMPLLSDAGTFIISGNENVVVSQLARSPGAYFSNSIDKNGKKEIKGDIHPLRGAWLEFETDNYGVLNVRVDRERKMPATIFLRAIGLETNEQLIELFGNDSWMSNTLQKDLNKSSMEALKEIYSKLKPGEPATDDGVINLMYIKYFNPKRYDLAKAGRYKINGRLSMYRLLLDKKIAEPLVDINGEVIYKKDSLITKRDIAKLKEISFFEKGAHLKRVGINDRLRVGEEGEDLIYLVKVYKDDDSNDTLNIIGNNTKLETRAITVSDIYSVFSIFLNSANGFVAHDDIDFLGNRRVRVPGELIQNEFKVGLSRMERNIRGAMSTEKAYEVDKSASITPQKLINIRPLTSILRQFFAYSQMVQYLDQTNPLAEIGNKRRISALGPGGLNKERAGVEVRDVHFSHYGRICPIETPEGANIGLIVNLASYAKVDKYGFVQTPYRKVDHKTNKVSDECEYLSAEDELDYIVAQANINLDKQGKILDDEVVVRFRGENLMVKKEEVDYVDVSPKQLISLSTAAVPFLESNDAYRALNAANMQRQGVPLLRPVAPLVLTGVEEKIAYDSGTSLISKVDGIVSFVDGKKIIIDTKKEKVTYNLKKFSSSNQYTCVNQIPRVYEGDKVKAGDVLADGSSIDNGQLALGQNVFVAFIPWDGYNYEDAVIISERLVKDDVYTSINIEDYSLECRDTKLGPEEITRDLPNVSEEAKAHLDIRGRVIPGTVVKEGDILVGKITPKGLSEPTPEEKLLMAIFGEKSKDGKDKSLRVPNGVSGTVVDVKYFSRKNGDELQTGVNELVRVYIARKRKISEGDKMAGRHGNKGVISRIVSLEDMPYLPDGTPIDMMLSPLGVPSRMNIGQILEMHTGYAAKKLGINVVTPVFDGLSQKDIEDLKKEAGIDEDGKTILYDGRTGEPFDARIAIGYTYMLKLSHMIDDKLHARATGPYSLITQQPLGGKAQNGGQRFGEMEVWALQAYGASYTLQEMMTVKSDDIVGRAKLYESIIKGTDFPEPGVPEAFKVLQKELQALGIDLKVVDNKDEVVDLSNQNVMQRRPGSFSETYKFSTFETKTDETETEAQRETEVLDDESFDDDFEEEE